MEKILTLGLIALLCAVLIPLKPATASEKIEISIEEIKLILGKQILVMNISNELVDVRIGPHDTSVLNISGSGTRRYIVPKKVGVVYLNIYTSYNYVGEYSVSFHILEKVEERNKEVWHWYNITKIYGPYNCPPNLLVVFKLQMNIIKPPKPSPQLMPIETIPLWVLGLLLAFGLWFGIVCGLDYRDKLEIRRRSRKALTAKENVAFFSKYAWKGLVYFSLVTAVITIAILVAKWYKWLVSGSTSLGLFDEFFPIPSIMAWLTLMSGMVPIVLVYWCAKRKKWAPKAEDDIPSP